MKRIEDSVNQEQYVRGIIRSYTAPQRLMGLAWRRANELRPCIGVWANNVLGGVDQRGYVFKPGGYLLGIRRTGSFAKGTCIVGGTDVDLFISLSSRTPAKLENIYGSLSRYLELCGLPIREQDVSIRVSYRGVSIDLVPGKKQPGATNDHSIYRRKGMTWTKTNVDKHVSHVKTRRRLNEIRAIKIWRKLRKLEFPSFCVELSVIEALRGRFIGRVSRNLERVFEYLASDFQRAKILDPANCNNVVSDDLTKQEKQTIARAALQSRLKALKGLWQEIIW